MYLMKSESLLSKFPIEMISKLILKIVEQNHQQSVSPSCDLRRKEFITRSRMSSIFIEKCFTFEAT